MIIEMKFNFKDPNGPHVSGANEGRAEERDGPTKKKEAAREGRREFGP
jgi:hypothetical protein